MAEPHRRMTATEYLAMERQSEGKHEFLAGEVFAMTGASRAHNAITLNVGAELRAQLSGGPCQPFVSDMRVQVRATGLYTYPDVVVACGEPQFEDDAELDTLLNPKLIVEVLSPSTEAYDRGKKFAHYRTIESLSEVLLIAQDRVGVEHFSLQPEGGWLLREATRLEDRVVLQSIGCELELGAIDEWVFSRAK